MVLTKFNLILNEIEYKILYKINEGSYGITYALTTKKNSTKYPILICKFYKNISNNTKTNIKLYNKLTKYNFIPKLYGIQTLSDKFEYDNNIYDKYIYYYEIGGICTLGEYISLLNLNNFSLFGINNLKKYINEIINNITELNKNNIIHQDLNKYNIMIKNNYTNYLFDLCNKLENEYNNNKRKEILKEINKYLFTNKNLNKNLLDNDNNKKKLISFIDFDKAIYLNETFNKYIKKYNLKNKTIKNELLLIYNIWKNNDIIKILYNLMDTLHSYQYNKYIKLILSNIENKYENILNNIIKNNEILNKLDKIISYNIINNIHNIIVNITNQNSFNKLFNYIHYKEYLKDKDYLYYPDYHIIENKQKYMK